MDRDTSTSRRPNDTSFAQPETNHFHNDIDLKDNYYLRYQSLTPNSRGTTPTRRKNSTNKQSSAVTVVNNTHKQTTNKMPNLYRNNMTPYEDSTTQNNISSARTDLPDINFRGRSRDVSHVPDPVNKQHYAQVLDAQIKAKNAQKLIDKIKEMENDKRLLDKGDFYKHFGK